MMRSTASLAPVAAIVCCVLRRKKFRFGHPVQAIHGGLLDVEFIGQLSSMQMFSCGAKGV